MNLLYYCDNTATMVDKQPFSDVERRPHRIHPPVRGE